MDAGRAENEFLEIDVVGLSDRELRDLCWNLKGSNHPSVLLSAKKEFVRRTRKTLSTEKIIRLITVGRTKENQQLTAEEWAEPLELSVKDFMRIASGKKASGT